MSSTQKKMSLLAAIFINLNVMIGSGIFLNAYDLAKTCNGFGFLLYPIIGICMLPLIAVTGKLLKQYPTGGLYAFAQEYSPYLGFLSCWSYFFGKLASACVMLTVASTIFQKFIPVLQSLPTLYISLSLLTFFTWLNLQNMKVGVVIQSFFLTAKSIPIIVALCAGFYYFQPHILIQGSVPYEHMALNIPLILYCLAGFETASALSRNIENPTINAPKAVYYSFGIIMMLYGVFQACIYMSTVAALPSIVKFDDLFPALAYQCLPSSALAEKLALLLNFAIGSSALGGAYGILFSNSWNLYTLAEHNHTFQAPLIKQLNKHHTPWMAVLIEAVTCMLFLICNHSALLPLRRTAALGIVVAYTISTFAYLKLYKKFNDTPQGLWIAVAACLTCTMFITTCIMSFIETGIAPLMLFIAILTLGTCMFIMKKNCQAIYK